MRDGRPRAAVGQRFNDVLHFNRRECVIAMRDMNLAQPGVIAFMTLIMPAIRRCDIGLDDDSVFGYSMDTGRHGTMTEVPDVRSALVSQVERATRDFAGKSPDKVRWIDDQISNGLP